MANERIEAEFTVPASTQVSVSSGALSAAVTVTATAGDSFMTDLVADLQTKINAAVTPYPQSAAAMAAAVGAGVYTTGAGYMCDEASGNLAAAYGSPTPLTARGTPLYGFTGPGHGGDKAVGFDNDADFFDTPATTDFDVNGTSDLIVAWVGKFTANPGAVTEYMFAKGDIGAGAHWTIRYGADGILHFLLVSASGSKESTVAPPIGEWYVGFAVIDRTAGNCRIGVRTLSGTTTLGSSTALFAGETLSNANNFDFGNRSASDAAINQQFSAFYIATGTSCASGMAAGLSTALTNFANAVNSAFTVSLSTTTGLITLSNSFWPCSISFTSTALRDVLGFAYNFDYPQTAAQMATALGYGTWTDGAGYLCNESSGNAAALFGSPATLTAAGTPTYSNLGARGGPDKALGMDSATDAFAGGASDFDVVSTDDLAIVWVGKFTASPVNNSTLISKVAAAFASGWGVVCQTASILFAAGASGAQASSASTDYMIGQPHVGIAVVDRSTGKLRIGIQSLTTGTTAIGSEETATGSYTTAASFILGASAWTSQAAYCQLSAFYIVSGSGVATGLSANLSTALSNFATYMKAQTGTQMPSGVWLPGRPINLDGDPLQAPTGDDKIATITPTGRVYSQTSSTYFRHRNVRFPMVAQPLVWANSATTVGADWETFYLETQLGQNSWFEVGSRVIVYWDNAGVLTELGNGDVEAWRMPQCKKLDDLRLSTGTWTGLVDVELGDLYADQ